MKILIRNLARITTEAQVRTLFEAFGKVQSCKLVMDEKSGASKGFGFIEMPKAGEAKVAIKNLNGKEIAEHKIRVKKAETKPDSDEENKDSVKSMDKEKGKAADKDLDNKPKKKEDKSTSVKEKPKTGFQGWKTKR